MSTSPPSSTGVGARVARGSHARSKHDLLEPYRRLFWRVFALNAAVLALACALAVIVFSPGTFSSQVALEELGIFLSALCVMIVATCC